MIELDQLADISRDNTNEHTLPVRENRIVFHEKIVPTLFGDPVELGHARPLSMVFLIGQQGAGKTHFAHRYGKRLFGHDRFVSVDSDAFKPFHPDYDTLLRKTSPMPGAFRWAAAEATRADVHRWQAQAEQWVLDNRVCALMQCSAKTPDTTASVMRRAHRAGFWRWAIFLGVPEARSRQGRLYRYWADMTELGYGRLTRPTVLAPAYEGALTLADMIETGGLAERATVYRQDTFPVPDYDHDRLARGAHRSGWLRQVVEDERTRPFTEGESEAFQQRQAWLWDTADAEFHDELEMIDRQAEPLVFPMNRAEAMMLRGVTGVT